MSGDSGSPSLLNVAGAGIYVGRYLPRLSIWNDGFYSDSKNKTVRTTPHMSIGREREIEMKNHEIGRGSYAVKSQEYIRGISTLYRGS